MAHPGWPWVEETTAVALHKGNVYWEMSGWAPKYFPGNLKVDMRGRLQDKIMFGSDYPSMPYERILREWGELGYKDEVMEKIFHGNAERVLASDAAPGEKARRNGPLAPTRSRGVLRQGPCPVRRTMQALPSGSTPCRNPSTTAPTVAGRRAPGQGREGRGAGREVRCRASRSRGATGGAWTRRSSTRFSPAELSRFLAPSSGSDRRRGRDGGRIEAA